MPRGRLVGQVIEGSSADVAAEVSPNVGAQSPRARALAAWRGVEWRWRLWAAGVTAVVMVGALADVIELSAAVAAVVLVPAGLVDVIERRLPDRALAVAASCLVIGLLVELIRSSAGWADVVIGAVVMALPLLVLHLVSPASMGFGDVKLAFVLGAVVGTIAWELAISALALAAGLSVSIAVLARARTIPFGPGLITGAALALAASSLLLPSDAVDDADGATDPVPSPIVEVGR